MPSRQITILHAGIIYDVVILQPNILRVYKTMEDSGIGGDANFNNLPRVVRELILKEIKETE